MCYCGVHRLKIFKTINLSRAAISKRLMAFCFMITLRPEQIDLSDKAVKILDNYNIACFAMEVRTGKTLLSLETARKFGATNVLFVTKLKAMSSIEADNHLLNPGFILNVINYESLHKIDDMNFDFVIVDEVHKCGAYPKAGKQQKQVRLLIKDKPCILMSGTFTPESFSQIFHILQVSNRSPFSEYKSFYKWANDYVTLKHKFMYGRQINDYSEADHVRIKEKTDHLFLSLTQIEAGFNQEITERIFTVEMKPETYNLAKRLKKDRVITGKSGTLLADTEVKLMNKLHQLYSGTVKLEDGNAITIDDSKVNFIKSNFGSSKIAILYKFVEEGELLRKVFKNNTSSPELFNSNNNDVFIGQIQSFREGVNLSSADYLIMYNIDYSAVSYFQARARMQAKDRTKPALVYWIFAKNSIDFHIYSMVKEKKNFTLSHFIKSDVAN